MLKRFQMDARSLEEHEVHDRFQLLNWGEVGGHDF